MSEDSELIDPYATHDKDLRYLPMSKRPGWHDVTPLPQDEGEHPPCPINYSTEFSETMDYFRAVMKAEEKSKRALLLTKEVIGINAASYTAWHYRREVLSHLGTSLEEDRAWLDRMAEENPKNYQLWYHRRWIVDMLQDPSKELAFTAEVLQQDGKNYHAWAHRQWVLERYGLWEGELAWIDTVLLEDRRNNSAWNQRYFVLSKTKDLQAVEVRAAEIEYAWGWIRKSPNNQSPWSYLSAMIGRGDVDREFPTLRKELEEAAAKYVTCPHALSVLIDVYQKDNTHESLQKAIAHCDALIERLAPIHEKYWTYRKSVLLQSLNSL